MMNLRTAKILIIEDNETLLENLEYLLRAEKYEVTSLMSGAAGLKLVESNVYDLVVSDFRLPDVTGDVILKRIRAISPYTATILITAYGNVDHAVELLRHGIDDYITKPFELKDLAYRIERLLEQQKLRRRVDTLQKQLQHVNVAGSIIGQSHLMQQVLRQVAMVASTDVPVIVEGESGVGKELVARAIHFSSARRQHPFLPVNCGALPDSLLESELFGHVRGAFTGADRHAIGLIEAASGGTLFLDEVTELTLSTQVKLLRTLQENEIRRVGSTHPQKIDVRFIAATNQNIEDRVASGDFREDLYYRLNVVKIIVPPLQDRPEDIPPLALHFLQKYSQKFNKAVRDFSPAAMQALIRHEWRGNVRELENVIQKALLVTQTSTIQRVDLDLPHSQNDRKPAGFLPYQQAKAEFERDYLIRALQESNGNAREAARRSGMHWKNFWQKLQKHHIQLQTS
ncbi:MAG: sigma-54-dependent Fis family transcriptional regulator [Gemmatimonadetes bacterium]|nr:MAG: sigma-54-dependent Fis family transcriptional regulator [Gemmatimonadota bacterium]